MVINIDQCSWQMIAQNSRLKMLFTFCAYVILCKCSSHFAQVGIVIEVNLVITFGCSSKMNKNLKFSF